LAEGQIPGGFEWLEARSVPENQTCLLASIRKGVGGEGTGLRLGSQPRNLGDDL
jgi:hypothetical protein